MNALSEVDQSYVARWIRSSREAIWPTGAKAAAELVEDIAVVREDSGKNEYVYRSAHFEFASDTRMSKNVVLEFSRVFEATHAALAALPLGHRLSPPEGETHFKTRIFRTREEYFQAGGFPGSAGLYVGETGEVLIPLSSLGVRVVGRRVILNREEGNATLVHELVHQLTASDQKNVPDWYREGLADYLASTPYRTGRFSFEGRAASTLAFLGNPPALVLPKLREFLHFGRRQFYGANEGLGEEARVHYAGALVLATYFFHLDGGRDGARMKAYLKGLVAGRSNAESVQILLDGRSYEELETDVQSAWGELGLPLAFGIAPPSPLPKIRP
jgi:hypothetical protein